MQDRLARTITAETDGLLREAEGLIQAQARKWHRLAPDLLDDCFQEARLALFTTSLRLVELEAEAHRPYLQACIRNAFCRWVRRQKQHLLREVPLGEVESGSYAIDVIPDYFVGIYSNNESFVSIISSDSLISAFNRLPPLDKRVLDLAYLEKKVDAEIAKLLGQSVSAVKKRRQRALRKMYLLLQSTGESA